MHDDSCFLHLPSAAELRVREITWQHVDRRKIPNLPTLAGRFGIVYCNVVFSHMCQATRNVQATRTHNIDTGHEKPNNVAHTVLFTVIRTTIVNSSDTSNF